METQVITEQVAEKVVMRPLSDLIPNPKNPRKSDPKGLQDLVESIRNNPRYFTARPILLSDRTGNLVIIAGERRSEAAKILGMKDVPTILLSGLSEAEEDEIMVRDNTHAGVWDENLLKKLSMKWGEDKLKSWMMQDEKKVKQANWKPVKDEGEIKFTEVLKESHNYVCLYFDNDVDWLNFVSLVGLKSVYGYSTRKDGKIDKGNVKFGVGRVMRGADVLEKLKQIWQG